MTGQGGYLRTWLSEGVAGWNRFWFTPVDSHTLSLIRICAGAMLFYTHLVWSIGLEAFFGPKAWITLDAIRSLPFKGPPGQNSSWWDRDFAWSYFYWIDSTAVLWIAHIAALIVFAMLTFGIFTRVTSVLSYLAMVSYANRVPGALFGLDETNTMIAIYLMIGASGAHWSFDAWWKQRQGRAGGATAAAGSNVPDYSPPPSISTNIAIRLLQLHLCIVYLFSGWGKLQGEAWWNGYATWGAVANLEYQSLDMTWLASHPFLISALTHLTVFWEAFYIALIWPRWTRPIMLFMAVLVHGGIGLFLGMKTFGLAMLIANMAFLPPQLIKRIFTRRIRPNSTTKRAAG